MINKYEEKYDSNLSFISDFDLLLLGHELVEHLALVLEFLLPIIIINIVEYLYDIIFIKIWEKSQKKIYVD